MCNLYSITTNQAAIIALFRVMNRYVGNLPPMPGLFPGYPAPVVRNADGERELTMMRWGMPPPPRTGGPPVTNISNTSSRTGAPGSSRKTGASSRPIALPSTRQSRTLRPKRKTWCGLRSVRIDRCLLSLASGPSSGATVAPSHWPASGLWLPDDIAKRGRRTDPSQGNVGDPHDR